MRTNGNKPSKLAKTFTWRKCLLAATSTAIIVIAGYGFVAHDTGVGPGEFVVAANAKNLIESIELGSRPIRRSTVKTGVSGDDNDESMNVNHSCIAPSADILAERERKQIVQDGLGYLKGAEYRRPYMPRHSPLTARELKAAKIAWGYFEKFTQEKTGLANSVGNYPSTTMWDTASYVSGMVAAYELCLIDKFEFDRRMYKLLQTFRKIDLFRKELPNKVYHTKTGAKVDYGNKKGEIGYSALDIGRFLIWMRIVKNRYPYFGNTIDNMLLRWDFSNVIDEEGTMYGAILSKHKDKGKNNKRKRTIYIQEGRLGYEEYAAKGFALWGLMPRKAHRAAPYQTAEINGVQVPYDGRDPRIFESQNYVVTEGYILDGMELNWDLPHDNETSDLVHSDGWRAEFADRIYLAQERRFLREGYLTARSEHNVKGKPYFVYDTIFSGGYAWNTVTPRGKYSPNFSAVATKAAFGMWALWKTEYTDKLIDAVINLYDPENGMFEGLYEKGQGPIEIFTANNNGILLGALLFKVQGRILTAPRKGAEIWYTAYQDRTIRRDRNLPNPPKPEDHLTSIRLPVNGERK